MVPLFPLLSSPDVTLLIVSHVSYESNASLVNLACTNTSFAHLVVKKYFRRLLYNLSWMIENDHYCDTIQQLLPILLPYCPLTTILNIQRSSMLHKCTVDGRLNLVQILLKEPRLSINKKLFNIALKNNQVDVAMFLLKDPRFVLLLVGTSFARCCTS